MRTDLLLVTLWLSFMAGLGLVSSAKKRPWPWLTLTVASVTLFFSCLANLCPAVMGFMRRTDMTAILHGELWRVFTPLFAQDGGWAGTVFNVACLLGVGLVAERLLSNRQWLVAYFGTGLLAELAAYTLFQHQGYAGNSIAIFGLSAAVLLRAVTSGHRIGVRSIGVLGIAAGFALLALGDLHGVAFVLGCVIAGMQYIGISKVQRHRSLAQQKP